MDISLEAINSMIATSLPGTQGIVFEKVEPGESVCKAEVTTALHNAGGILHGGVPYTMADTGMAMALIATMEGAANFSTVEIKMSYFRPVVEGTLVCRTRMIKKGKRIAFFESTVSEGEHEIAHATGSYCIL